MSNSFFTVLCFLAILVSAAPQFVFSGQNFFQGVPSFCSQIPISNTAVGCNFNVRPTIRYYYDVRSRDCERIAYFGCGATQNLFRSERECEARCDNDDSSFEIDDFFSFFGK